MNGYSTWNPWVRASGILMTVLMFCGYYFSLSALCFLIAAPDQALVLDSFKSMVPIFIFGGISGAFLSVYGVASAPLEYRSFF